MSNSAPHATKGKKPRAKLCDYRVGYFLDRVGIYVIGSYLELRNTINSFWLLVTILHDG